MEEAQTHLANKKFFSKLDATQAYHAVKLADERSIQLLSFSFESRVFAYTRLAQGLNRASTAFSSFVRQHLAANIAADWAASFMDDICSTTESFPQHLDALDHIFASIGRSGLRLSMKKCEFGVAEIKFLGWTVSKHGIGTQKEKIDAQLAIIKMPRNVKATQRMIGFMQYYRQYIPYLSPETATVLQTHQTWKPVQGRAGTPRRAGTAEKRPEKRHAENAAFNTRIVSTRRETVCADDGRKRVGGRFRADGGGLHEEPGRKKETKTYAPVAFGSREFTHGQYNLTTHAKEFLAVYLAFDSFAHILWGIVEKPVIVLTDNIALASFLQAKTLPPTLCKDVDRILQFKFVLAHIPGKGNPVADYLSRMHHNPHLHLDLTVKGKIPVYDIQVELEPKSAG